MGRYAIFNGLVYGGGTDVIPNPEGTPTDELHSLQIGNDIYEIVGGSGASAIEKTQAEYDALTPAQKTNGAIYMVEGGEVETAFDMTNIVKYIESNVDVTSSQDETTFTWDGGSLIGMTMYYVQKVDLTNAHTISYSLTTGTCYGGNPLRNFAVGVCETAPSAVTAHSSINYAVHNVYDDSDASSQFPNETLDVSELTGEYYIVVTGFGWNATLSNIATVEAGEAVNKIYYMGTEYANTNGGSGGGGTSEGVEIYSEDEYIVGKWIDGKKLYQRTYHLAQAITVAGGGSWTNTGIDISDISILVDSKFSQDVAVWDAINGINDNGTLKATILASGSLTVDTITIRYTKTVETPAPAWGGSVINNYAGFIDADNVIYSTISSSTTDTYTATEDCYIMHDIVTGSTVSTVTIDGEAVAEYLVSGTQIIAYNAFLKKGQVLTATHGGTALHTIKVFGITYASGGSSSGSSVEYSTEEKEVGTWIDGSKVYEKTIFNNNLTDTSTVPNAMYVGDIPNDVAIVTELSASVCDSTHLGWVTGGGISTVNGWNFGLHITSGKVVLYGNTVSAIQGGMAIVKIRYTKAVS